jgi:hypothetical protein
MPTKLKKPRSAKASRGKSDDRSALLVEWMAMSIQHLSQGTLDKKSAIDAVEELIAQHGVTKTLKRFQHLRSPRKKKCADVSLYTVTSGVLEVGQYGQIDAALETQEGDRFVVRNGRRTNQAARLAACDDQTSPSDETDSELRSDPLYPAKLLSNILNAGTEIPAPSICEAEFVRFDSGQLAILMPILWKYIIDHRKSNSPDELAAVGSAIRKYIAIMPMDRMGELSVLLAPANHEPLPLALELEVSKMIYRNFEVYPPSKLDSQPELALRLWEMVQAYVNPRILLRDKHSAVASLAIEALVSMRSKMAFDAWRAALDCAYQWFGEMVTDDLLILQHRWTSQDAEAANWLNELRVRVLRRGESHCAQ